VKATLRMSLSYATVKGHLCVVLSSGRSLALLVNTLSLIRSQAAGASNPVAQLAGSFVFAEGEPNTRILCRFFAAVFDLPLPRALGWIHACFASIEIIASHAAPPFSGAALSRQTLVTNRMMTIGRAHSFR
jgi:hypothetical protein